ncbi:hypothetical protein BDB00DRAFT_838143 [Zychaea mexicana]|uniref:uncharacterized protein n=1 Tax=Zychaea mexicana TaxID=64656 RepID=UPI0022FE8136|nr:uncharacterized protein BDB00DRAFT_838143 [Zychaea mexicana]KAI9490356.1 hypothetical protein BDB00DRAFT_838143 [Zychaea mexicana]
MPNNQLPLSPSSQQQAEQYTNASFATAATDGPGQRSSLLSNNSASTGTNTNRWSRTFKRLSMPFSHQHDTIMMPWSQSFQLHSSTHHHSSHHYHNNKSNNNSNNHHHSQQQVPQATLDPEQEKESTVVFTVETFVAANDVIGLRYSKLDGSAKVFKYAKGWITGVLAYNTEFHSQQQQQQQ